MGRVLRHLVALASMAGGTAGVLWLALSMNAPAEGFAEVSAGAPIAIDVAPPPPRKKPRRKKKAEPKKETPRPTRPPPAPAPSLNTGLSSVSLGGIGGPAAGFGDATAALVVNEATDIVMTEASVDQAPVPVRRTPPKFPPRARASGVTGQVTLRILIGTAGEVQQVRVLDAEPPGVFEQAAREAVQSWRFRPATYQGRPVKVWARQTLAFKLG